jgi:hypothetical protein
LFKGVGDAIEKAVMKADPTKAFGGGQQQPQMQQPVMQQPAQTFAQPANTFPQQQYQPPAGQQFTNQPMGLHPQQPAQGQVQPNYGGLPPQFRK